MINPRLMLWLSIVFVFIGLISCGIHSRRMTVLQKSCIPIIPYEIIDGYIDYGGAWGTVPMYNLKYNGRYSGRTESCSVVRQVTKEEYSRQMYNTVIEKLEYRINE